jgi:hypothetical protein
LPAKAAEELPGSDDTMGRIVKFITVLGEVLPAAFAVIASESSTTASGGGVIVSAPLT